jgi:hypothetical protein
LGGVLVVIHIATTEHDITLSFFSFSIGVGGYNKDTPNPYREGEETECDVVFGSSYVYYNKDTPQPL